MSDMAINSWHIEKISNSMEALVNMAEDMLGSSSGETGPRLQTNLSYALANTTKLYLSMHGKQGSGTEHFAIVERGRDAFEELRLANGLRGGKTVQECIENIPRLMTDGPSSRTGIYDLLSQCVTSRSRFVIEAIAIVDKRAMGEMKWEEFTVLMNDIITRYRGEPKLGEDTAESAAQRNASTMSFSTSVSAVRRG